MAFIGTTYYWMDDRTDVWEIPWLIGSVIWYAAILFAISFVKQKARLGYLIGGVLAWVTLAFWLFDNFYVVFELSLVASEPSLEITIRNFIGAALAGLAIFSSHNVFHKVRVYQVRENLYLNLLQLKYLKVLDLYTIQIFLDYEIIFLLILKFFSCSDFNF